MKQFKEMRKWFVEEESGQGMVEYGLIIVLIAIAVVAALTTVGDQLVATFEKIGNSINPTP